ncbi:MAG: c-type cytochrome [Spirosomataceae bacterium]
MIFKYVKHLSYTLRATALSVALALGSISGFAQDAAAPDPAMVDKGKTLFTNNCASCHNVSDQKLVGPGLKGIDQRRNEAWIIKWVKNPAAVIASGDSYAVDLYNKFNKAQMTAFTNFQDDDIRSILAYVKASEAVAAKPAGDGGTGGTATSGGGESSGLFNTILIALLSVMVLVLIALFAVVSMLTKLVKPGADEEAENQTPFLKRFTSNLEALAANQAFKTGSLLLFVLMAGKATIDGLYGVGIHTGYAPKQPIEFSHKLHAGQYKINCNYCHTGVYKGKGANIPSANICMNCHGVIKRESPQIQKIYQAIEQDKPIEWVRVHNLPDLAYFNHAQHTNVGGVQCQQCHGEVEKMEVIEQRSSLTMGWCIDCHRQTNVNAKGNAYYDKLMAIHKGEGGKDLKVANIGGLECSKCHY